jgi:hypothetical protein
MEGTGMKRKRYTRQLAVLVDDEMYRQIKDLTDQEEIGISDFIRDAIERKITSCESDTKTNNQPKSRRNQNDNQ